jgi:hypothetical protein
MQELRDSAFFHVNEYFLGQRTIEVDVEFARFATKFLVEHPVIAQQVAKSQANPGNLYVTKTCYDDAFDFLEGVLTHHKHFNKSTKHWRLCHGILTQLDETGSGWGHAWVELGETVFEGKLLSGQRVYVKSAKKEWCDIWKPKYVKSYTFSEAKAELAKSGRGGNAGPWDPKILGVANHFDPGPGW